MADYMEKIAQDARRKPDLLEQHVLLDGGEPHCTCRYSNRGKHLCKYHDHAIEALRLQNQQLAQELRDAVTLLGRWWSFHKNQNNRLVHETKGFLDERS